MHIFNLHWSLIGFGLLVLARCKVKLAFHDADTYTDNDILARILADRSDTRDFLKLFLWQLNDTPTFSR